MEIHRELTAGGPALGQMGPPIEDERYEFIEEIARGGAAVVWRVRDRHLGRETAVKFLLDSQDNREMRTRLEREARLCARLVHPGIVPIHELSSFADQRPFVSMKLVEGKTLLQMLDAKPPLPIKTALEIFTKACQAMAYSHQRGIIHRDLKPGNIMVGSFGEVQIMDWGLAKDLNDHTDRDDTFAGSTDGSAVVATSDNSGDTLTDKPQNEATIVGSVFGTIAYMSPEQANGKIALIDKWSDVFSLGAVLCRILTGIPPYQDPEKGLDPDAMLMRAQKGDLKLAFDRLARAKPHKLAALAVRCMAVDPGARPADAGEIARELERIRQATLRTTHTLRFFAFATTILFVTCALVWANRGQKAANITTFIETAPKVESEFSFRELIHEKVSLDSETAKALLNSSRKEVVLDNYRPILDKNSADESLYSMVAMALMNSERWADGEDVLDDLIEMNPRNADYQFLLSETLSRRGRYDEAKSVMLHGKELQDSGSASQFPIEESLRRLDKYIEILQQVKSQSLPSLEALSLGELVDVGHACAQADEFEIAESYYRRAIEKEPDTFRQTLVRHNLLHVFVRQSLRRKEIQGATRHRFNALCLEWMQAQIDSLPRLTEAQASQLKSYFASKEFEFARKLADDQDADAAVRAGLTKLFSALLEANADVAKQ
ncbi:MAG: protein kinase [Pirellulaceae bacterium]|nr:protein kinase [Pirellulaceae bacterium]